MFQCRTGTKRFIFRGFMSFICLLYLCSFISLSIASAILLPMTFILSSLFQLLALMYLPCPPLVVPPVPLTDLITPYSVPPTLKRGGPWPWDHPICTQEKLWSSNFQTAVPLYQRHKSKIITLSNITVY